MNGSGHTAFFSFLVRGLPDFESSGTIRLTSGALSFEELFSTCSASRSRSLEGPACVGSMSMYVVDRCPGSNKGRGLGVN